MHRCWFTIFIPLRRPFPFIPSGSCFPNWESRRHKQPMPWRTQALRRFEHLYNFALVSPCNNAAKLLLLLIGFSTNSWRRRLSSTVLSVIATVFHQLVGTTIKQQRLKLSGSRRSRSWWMSNSSLFLVEFSVTWKWKKTSEETVCATTPEKEKQEMQRHQANRWRRFDLEA